MTIKNNIKPFPGNLKAVVRKIVPSGAKATYISRTLVYSENSKCYIGISISNPNFSGEYLYAVFSFILKNFKYCSVFIDDYFHQHNEKAFTGYPEERCIDIAAKRGREIELFISTFLNEHFEDDSYRFTITKSSAIASDAGFRKHSLFFHRIFDSNVLFRQDVMKSATDYVNRQVKRGNIFSVDYKEALSLSCKYLMEELAIFTFFCDAGYDTEVYPGPELPVLVSIANGKFEGMPLSLLNRINIEIAIIKDI